MSKKIFLDTYTFFIWAFHIRNLRPRSHTLSDFKGPGAVALQQAWDESFTAEDQFEGKKAIVMQ